MYHRKGKGTRTPKEADEMTTERSVRRVAEFSEADVADWTAEGRMEVSFETDRYWVVETRSVTGARRTVFAWKRGR